MCTPGSYSGLGGPSFANSIITSQAPIVHSMPPSYPLDRVARDEKCRCHLSSGNAFNIMRIGTLWNSLCSSLGPLISRLCVRLPISRSQNPQVGSFWTTPAPFEAIQQPTEEGTIYRLARPVPDVDLAVVERIGHCCESKRKKFQALTALALLTFLESLSNRLP